MNLCSGHQIDELSGVTIGGRSSFRPIFRAAEILLGNTCKRFSAILCGVVTLFVFGLMRPAFAADTPPAMIVPGQMNVSSTGAFTYTIPIAAPPGTAGMAPALSLDYSSQNGDGTVGLGWSLSGLPMISRCPRTLAQDAVHGQVNYDSNDRFCMDGKRLVAISGTYGANGTEYRTEIDGFSKIISYGTAGNGPSYFKVWTKAGQIMEFGNTADSQVLAQAKTTARAWAVNKISDTKGNYLTITYNSATGSDRTTNGEVYPTRIDYTGNDGAGLAAYNSVQFVYMSRPDVIPAYQASSLQQTTVLLTHLKTYQGSTLVSDYRLAYQFGDGATPSELASVTLCDGSQTPICLAPTSFVWQGDTDLPAMSTVPNGIAQGPGTASVIIPADFTGDGLTDFMAYLGGTSGCIFAGTENNSFTPSGIITDYQEYVFNVDTNTWELTGENLCSDRQPTPFNFDGNDLADATVILEDAPKRIHRFAFLNNGQGTMVEQSQQMPAGSVGLHQEADFNGDGREDIFIGGSSTSSYIYTSNGDGTFTQSSALSGLDGSYVDRLPSDFDGDGCADLLIQNKSTNSGFIRYFCNTSVTQVTVTDWLYSNYQIVLGDFNGDGKTDVFRYGNGAPAALFLSNGVGLNSTATWTSSAIQWDKYAIYTGDFNGDGKTDLLLVADGAGTHYGVTQAHQIWLSTGNGFISAGTIPNSNASGDAGGIRARIADWNNDGADDIWIQKPSGDTQYLFAHKSPLLISVQNGLNVTTTVTYDRLNKNGSYYTKGVGATYPTRDVDGPFYVVSRVDSSNGLGNCLPPNMTNCYSSTYTYAGLKYDLYGRGFLGFSSVLITDVQTGVVQTTNYRTDFPYLGLIVSQTKTAPKTGGGTVTLSSTVNTLGAITLGTGSAARKFIELQQSVVSGNDEDFSTGTAYTLPTVTTTYAYDCDSNPNPCYGNTTQVSVSVSDGSSKVTTNTYDNDATNWFLGRLRTANVQSIVGSSNLTRHTSYTYDAATGLLTSEIVEPGASDPSLTLETDYIYDAYGNKIETDVKGCVWSSGTCVQTTRTTHTAFDIPTYHASFATGITNALSQSESWQYSQAFGLPTSHAGPNNLTATWSYDTFGRKTLEVRPDQNRTAISYAYCAGVNGGTAICPTNSAFLRQFTPENSTGAQNGPISITYYDGLSRAIASDVQGFDGSWIRAVTQYDANGRVSQASKPYFLSGGTPVWTVNTYDAIGRVIKTTAPDTSYTNYTYQGLTAITTVHVLRPGLSAQDQTTTTVKNAQGLNASVTNTDGKTTSYVYDAFGDLLTATDPDSNVTTNVYDIRGRKTDSIDPDMGHWAYAYDSYGELSKQTDAKGQVTTLSYDMLGRMLSRIEADMTSTWTYDTASYGVGKVATATTGSNYLRTHTYDTLGRPSTVTLKVDGTNYVYRTTYNSNGQVDTVTYPSGLVAKHVYTSLGYLSQIKDNSAGTVWWQANARDAEMHLLQSTAANGVITTQSFDPNTGLVQQIRAGVNDSVFNTTYTFDSIGNLYSRADTYDGYVEQFCYDDLNRLTNSAIGATCTASGGKTIAYNELGNITSKSDACTAGSCAYSYGVSAGPHALTSITGTVNGVVNPTYVYDGNGNMTSGAGRTITYTSFNMAASIVQGTTADCFVYDSEHQRVEMDGRASSCTGALNNTTFYLNAMGAMSEKFIAGSATTWHDFIIADGHMVAERFATVGGSTSLRYFVLDHLGSVAAITDEAGTVTERLSYDAWGKRRSASGTDASCGSISSATTRGFAGQEELDNICLINMNARIYDPVVGRFMTADPTLEAPFNLQDSNRYSYVLNNPLSFADPSGLCFLGCFWEQSWFAPVLAIALVLVGLPELEIGTTIFDVSATELFSQLGVGLTILNAGIAGGIAGGLSSGTLQGALLGAAQGAFFAGMVPGFGGALNALLGTATTAPFVGNFIASGFVGGLFSMAQGGHFASGFLAAGIGSLGASFSGNSFTPGGLVISTVLGGAASVLGGGKFANGAITAAFAYAASTATTSSGTVEATKMTPEEYNRILANAGVNGTFSNPGTLDLATKVMIYQLLDQNPDVFLDFLSKASEIFTEAVACNCEPYALRVYLDYADNNLTVETVEGTPLPPPKTGEDLPELDQSGGILLFQWHPHPIATPYPSPTDLISSMNTLFAPGVIWSNTEGGYTETWYQGLCKPGTSGC